MNANRTLRPLAAAIALALSGPAGAAVIPVDGTTCTLADAISAANTDATTGGCPAGQGKDLLELTAETYGLTSPLPDITSGITINGDPDGDGKGAVIERSGAPGTPDFGLFAIGRGDLTLNHATLRNGAFGIRVDRDAFAHLTHSTITGMARSAIGAFGGAASVSHSTLAANGSGLYCSDEFRDQPRCVVADSLITGNQTGISANVYAGIDVRNSRISHNRDSGVLAGHYGDISVTDCTISGNGTGAEADENSAFIRLAHSTISGNGTGVDTVGRVTVADSTISGNGTGAKCHYYYASLHFSNATVSHNLGSGIDAYCHYLKLTNTIVSGNRGGDCSLRLNDGPDLTSNLIGDGSCEAEARGALTGDAKLGPLKDNGGRTFTHALLRDSPALDAGTGCEATDQRGATRPQNAACDLGAYESVSKRAPAFRPVLTFFDQAVQEGTLTGTLRAPNRWHRLQAVRRQLLLAGDLQLQGSKTATCKQTGRTLGRIDADGTSPDANDYVTGPASPDLGAALRALRSKIGCR